MFENTRFSDMDEAIISVLDILASVADITEPRKYNFFLAPENSTFKSIKNKKIKSKNIDFKRKFRQLLMFIIPICPSICILLIGILVKHFQEIPLPSPLKVDLVYFLLCSALGLLIIHLIIELFIAKEDGKYPANKLIKQAKEDAIAYRPVVSAIYKITKGDEQKLKAAESIIKSLIIEERKTSEKNMANLLPIWASFVVLIVWLFFPNQLPVNTPPNQVPVNTLLYNQLITVAGLGAITLPIWKFITESSSQFLILKFKRCLFILEQVQARANNTNKQVIPVTSTKRHPQFGSARGLIQMSDDFDAPLTDFDDYMP